MNALKDTFRALVRRRLWPVAVVLLAGLIAVPVLLAKSPEPVSVAAAPHTTAADETTTFVQPVSDDGTTDAGTAERRRVLGPDKDPFEPRALPKAKKTAKKTQAAAPTAKATPTPEPASTPAGGGGAVTSPVAPVATPIATAKPTYPEYSIKVLFGKTDGEKTTKTVKRLEVMPSLSDPLLVYRGVEDNGKTAIFDLTGDVTALGDGACLPSADDCQVLKLKAGETSFITINDTQTGGGAQYELQVKEIHVKATTSQEKLAKSSSDVRDLLEANGTDNYAFDPATGTLHKLSAKDRKKLTASARRKSL
jgi:hypothetical protein